MTLFDLVNQVVDEFRPSSEVTSFNLILVRKESPIAGDLRFKLQNSISDDKLREAIAKADHSKVLNYVIFEENDFIYESHLTVEAFREIYGLTDDKLFEGQTLIVK